MRKRNQFWAVIPPPLIFIFSILYYTTIFCRSTRIQHWIYTNPERNLALRKRNQFWAVIPPPLIFISSILYYTTITTITQDVNLNYTACRNAAVIFCRQEKNEFIKLKMYVVNNPADQKLFAKSLRQFAIRQCNTSSCAYN